MKEQANGFNDFLTPVGENIIKARIEKSINCQSTSTLETLSTTAYSRNPNTGTEVCSVHDEGEAIHKVLIYHLKPLHHKI